MSSNKEIWESYTRYTKDLTEYSRKLGFAGVAIFWILKNPDGSFSVLMKIALIFFILFFVFDIAQSYVGSRRRLEWNQSEEQKMFAKYETIDGEYHWPRELDIPAQRYFRLKVGALISAYSLIVAEMMLRFVQ
ncbi:hypothetical protein [Puniceicoccus vermicola]|uniref:Uncharacterized protein n=1 Tax=Puniceicoccus vermicola TaxID=388746 RepID=A0A7X1AXM8_9BACT|nr:hypothetical protein [Puniceicoccus vermicola]MBC2601757.1 hypothetical protein [Puniceicoccus vermicola]